MQPTNVPTAAVTTFATSTETTPTNSRSICQNAVDVATNDMATTSQDNESNNELEKARVSSAKSALESGLITDLEVARNISIDVADIPHHFMKNYSINAFNEIFLVYHPKYHQKSY